MRADSDDIILMTARRGGDLSDACVSEGQLLVVILFDGEMRWEVK